MKRDIKINRAKISSEEIQKGKNFSELTKAYKAQVGSTPTKPFYKKGWFAGTVASVALITTAVIMLNTNNKEKETSETQNTLSVLSDTTKTQFINPPAPGIDVKKDRYFVNAGNGGVIKHHTGTEIQIPENSFVHEDGTSVSGEVEIQYREFHDQIDIFFSGIPMEYDSAGVKYNFESAGMMEFYAYQNGEKLKIAPQKELQVSMVSYNPDSKFNLYYLDEEAKNWDYRGKDSIVNNQDFTYQPSPLNESELIDEALFPKQQAVQEQEEVVEVIQKDIKTIETAKPVKPIKAQKNVHSFDIDVNEAEFPEIAEYEGTLFEVIDQVNFDAKIYDIQWEDIELKQNGTNLCVELKKGNQTKKIDVKPVLEGQDYTTAIKEFSKKFDTYSKKLTKRKDDEKVALAELQKRREAYKDALAQQQILVAKNLKKIASDYTANRVFNVNRTGTWNCDYPLRYVPSGIKVLAFYKNKQNNKDIGLSSLCLIEKRLNAKWPIASFQNGVFEHNPKVVNYLCGVTEDGNIAIAKPEEFKGAKDMKKHEFLLEVIDPTNKTITEIKELIKA